MINVGDLLTTKIAKHFHGIFLFPGTIILTWYIMLTLRKAHEMANSLYEMLLQGIMVVVFIILDWTLP